MVVVSYVLLYILYNRRYLSFFMKELNTYIKPFAQAKKGILSYEYKADLLPLIKSGAA